MPKIEEYAELEINGRRFRDWKSVSVQCDFYTCSKTCNFEAVEVLDKALSYATLQIKPGDKCTVYLAGQKAMTGFVTVRSAAIDATSHGVLISARDITGDLVDSSLPMKGSQMRDYGFEQIARSVLKPFNISLKMVNVPQEASKKFKDVSWWPGESPFELLDRLARQRGMYIRSDENGALVVGTGSTSPNGDLVEGVNILSANCLIRDDTLNSKYGASTQQRGDDQTSGDKAATPTAEIDGPSSRYRPRMIMAEEPGDSDDMKVRAQHERDWTIGMTVECNVVTQGWLKPNGSIWSVEDCITVSSKSLLLNGVKLGPTSVTFSQDASGTRTTIAMVRPEARGRLGNETATVSQDALLPSTPAEKVGT